MKSANIVQTKGHVVINKTVTEISALSLFQMTTKHAITKSVRRNCINFCVAHHSGQSRREIIMCMQ